MRLFILSTLFLDQFQLKVLEPLFSSDKIHIVGVCIDNRTITNIQKIKREWKKGRGGYILVMIVNKILSRFKKEPSVSAYTYFTDKKVPTRLIKKLYSHETLEFIKDKKSDCIFRSGFGIIREPLLSLAPKGMISYHHGNIRKYRGKPAAFWELYHGESGMSATVQILNEGLDSGKIVQEIEIPIYWNDTWSLLRKRVYERSHNLIYKACLLLDDDRFEPEVVAENELGDVYTSPTFRQWFTLQTKILFRKYVKSIIFSSII
jgi:folate-dependent phosphoribosylglycinamide formyltransferase PurN